MPILNFDDKYALANMQPNAMRIWVVLFLHCNGVLRCHPSFETMQTNLDISESTLLRGIRWLRINGAVVVVPVQYRNLDEKSLPATRNVYQLTGIVIHYNKFLPLVYMNEHTAETILATMSQLIKWTESTFDDWFKTVTTKTRQK